MSLIEVDLVLPNPSKAQIISIPVALISYGYVYLPSSRGLRPRLAPRALTQATCRIHYLFIAKTVHAGLPLMVLQTICSQGLTVTRRFSFIRCTAPLRGVSWYIDSVPTTEHL